MDELNRLAQHRNSLEAYLTAMGQQCRIPISKYQSFVGEIKTMRLKYNRGLIMSRLRPQYHYFKGYSRAKEFADEKNSRARVNQWLVRANGEGYTVYNLRSDVCPMLTESYGESGTIQAFQDRLNQEVRF